MRCGRERKAAEGKAECHGTEYRCPQADKEMHHREARAPPVGAGMACPRPLCSLRGRPRWGDGGLPSCLCR